MVRRVPGPVCNNEDNERRKSINFREKTRPDPHSVIVSRESTHWCVRRTSHTRIRSPTRSARIGASARFPHGARSSPGGSNMDRRCGRVGCGRRVRSRGGRPPTEAFDKQLCKEAQCADDRWLRRGRSARCRSPSRAVTAREIVGAPFSHECVSASFGPFGRASWQRHRAPGSCTHASRLE